jgi:Zn-dependent M28 family amino/carboxypeptidase
VATVLEVARILAAHPGGVRRTVRFVTFSAEEYGLLGSTVHVDRLRDRGEDVELMLSLDPIGYDPGGSSLLWVPYDDRWPEPADRLAEVAVLLGERLDVSTIDADLIGGDLRSDHAPFWAADLPALHLASFPQPPTYHTVSDDLDVVDPAFHFEVTALVTAFVGREAELSAADDLEACEGCESALGGRPDHAWRGVFATLGMMTALAAGRRRRR